MLQSKVLMANRKQAGFTLVEIIVALAIASLLLIIAFSGQRGLRSRAQFDGTIDQVVASVATAHSKATAGVNTAGPGDGSQNCTGAVGGNDYVFAGVAWNAVDAAGITSITLDYYAATRNALPAACIFSSDSITLPSSVRVDVPGAMRRLLFVRDDFGSLNICKSSGSAGSSSASFQKGLCQAPSAVVLTHILTFSDAEGHKAQVQIDPGGLAKRLN